MIEIIRAHVIPAAYAVLPPAMKSDEATALMLAIGWQESRFAHRTQIGGPARGFYQFEQRGGVHGVLGHAQTAGIARSALKSLGYPHEPTPFSVYDAIAHNDVLATVFARLLLWTLPGPLPGRANVEGAWKYYERSWRPGKPHPETWAESWRQGWVA